MVKYLAAEDLAGRATPSNMRLGRENAAHIEIVESSAEKVVAKAGGGALRTVSFAVADAGLAWHCTCRCDQPSW
jgi:hypothetical protein